MLKIVILLCIALVASAVDPSGTKDQFESQQKEFQSYFATNIANIDEKYNTAITWEKAHKVLTDTNSVNEEANNDVSKIKNKALAEFNELIGQTARSDAVLDCHKMRSDIDSKGRTYLEHVSKCTTDIKRSTIARVMDVRKKYKSLRQSLIDYRTEIAACDETFKKTQQVDDAFSCTKSVEAKNGPVIAESTRVLFAKMDETNDLLATSTTSLAGCSNGYTAFETEAADLTARAKECYRRVYA